jgi:homoserine kinase
MKLIYTSASVFAPATVANVGCGFDVLGMAIDKPGDQVDIQVNSTHKEIRITQITGDDGRLPLDSTKNTASVALAHLLESIKWKGVGFDLQIHKQMPLGSGLGSSAASSVGALAAFNALLETPLSPSQLLLSAMEGERAACGSAHADNVAAGLFGGFVLIRDHDPVDVIPISTPENLYCTVVHPDLELNTADSRSVLKREIDLATAVKQWANVGGLIAGLLQKDLGLIRRSMVDHIIEPRRAALIPGFVEVKKAAMAADALGASISGAGPSIFALSDDAKKAKIIGERMQESFNSFQIASEVFVSRINQNGPIILDRA